MKHYIHLCRAVLMILVLPIFPVSGASEPLSPGHVRFEGGAQLIYFDKSALEMKKAMADNARNFFAKKPKEVLSALQQQSSRDVWPINLTVVPHMFGDEVQSICDQYINYFLLPQLRDFPPRFKKLRLNVSDTKKTESRHCEYLLSNGTISYANDGLPFKTRYERRTIELKSLKPVWIAPVFTEQRLDMEKPHQNYLLALPREAKKPVEMSEYVEATAKRLYGELGEDQNISFYLAHQSGDTGFNPLRARVMTVPWQGGVMQISNIKLHMGRIVAKDPSAAINPAFHVRVIAFNPKLQAAIDAGNREQYTAEKLVPDSRRYFDAVGEFAAEAFEVDTVFAFSWAQLNERGVKLTLGAGFDRKGENWVDRSAANGK